MEYTGAALESAESKSTEACSKMSIEGLVIKSKSNPSAFSADMEETRVKPTDGSVEKTVCSYYLEGKCRFGDACFNLHPLAVAVTGLAAVRNETQKKKTKTEEVETDTKKPSLKTAGDVRKRIQWDPELQKEHFTVGYLDRFSGVVEKPFTAFSWEHLSMVDLDQLAVPQHRIQYYKYKGVKVWDKKDRLDHIFGSAGNNITIQQIIQEDDSEIERDTQTSDPDDDSDGELVVMGEVTSTTGLIPNVSKQELLRATHFFCIRVENYKVKSSTAIVQEHVVREEPVLRSCIMPTELLHVTLAMVRVDTPKALLDAINVLQNLKPKIKEILGPPSENEIEVPERVIRAQGLSTFGARVLYSKLQVPSSFTTIVDMLYQSLRNIDDITVTNHFDLVPHMTLLKVNRPTARERRSKYINSSLYSDYNDCEFGNINFNNVHFCVIDDMRGPGGFYVTCEKIEF